MKLRGLEMVPFHLRNFSLSRPSQLDIQWLHHVVDREYRRFGGKVLLTDNGTMRLDLN